MTRAAICQAADGLLQEEGGGHQLVIELGGALAGVESCFVLFLELGGLSEHYLLVSLFRRQKLRAGQRTTRVTFSVLFLLSGV